MEGPPAPTPAVTYPSTDQTRNMAWHLLFCAHDDACVLDDRVAELRIRALGMALWVLVQTGQRPGVVLTVLLQGCGLELRECPFPHVFLAVP
eukprot:4921890-Alexandrium_andersonii.AAC.2